LISNRREFLQGSGALIVGIALPGCAPQTRPSSEGSAILGNRLTLHASGVVELFLGKVELGQGIGTALAQIAAEELDLNIDRIRLRSVDTDVSPDEFYTFSSISIQQSGPPTRLAAAAAREHFRQHAAQKLSATLSEINVVDGELHDSTGPTGHSYWSLIGDDTITVNIEQTQALKPTRDYRLIGQSIERIDIPAKVYGDASFLQDLRLPNMVHARVVRPATERATVKSFDSAPTNKLPGVLKILRDSNFIAVVAEREGQARNAAALLAETTEWLLPEDLPSEGELHGWLRTAPSRHQAIASSDAGITKDPATLETINASYQRPYQAHASISPSAAIALFDGQRLTVWSHAQGMYPLRAGIAHILNLDIADVRCIHYEASGCFGHNGADDAACDAAAIAMQYPGKPVRLQWERADEMTWEPLGSAMRMDISADVDASGSVQRWQYDLWSCPHTIRPRDKEQAGNLIFARHREQALDVPPIQSIPQPNGGADRNGIPLYTFPSMQVTKHLVTEVPMRVSALRGLGAFGNIFAIESFMDELSVRADEDSFEYRLRHLDDLRAIELLRRLRHLSKWQRRPNPGTGVGWGLGFARFKNRSAWLGLVAKVAIVDGVIRLHQAIAVCDAGLVINPDGVKSQIEGGIVQSASWTLKERVRFSQQKKTSVDWSSYPILRFDEVPEVDVELMARAGEPSLGVGEAAQGPTAAAIANAVFHATGQRLREMPLKLALPTRS